MKKLAIITALALSPTLAMASDDISYNAFVKYRNFGSKKGVTSAPEVIITNPEDGAKAYFPSINSLAMSYFGNLGRTVQDTLALGDWSKQYRVNIGYEQNYVKSDNSKSSYGYREDIGNLYVHADKKITQDLRLGAGVVIGYYDTDYAVADMYQKSQNIMTTYHLAYKNKEYDILHRSIAYLGYGHTNTRRVATEVHKADFSTLYYGLENIVQKNIKVDNTNFYIRPVAELNYYGTKQEGFVESGNGFDLPHNSAYKIDIGLALYTGYKAKTYDIRVGYDWTSILSDPRKAYGIEYYDGTVTELDKKTSDNNYGTWRASFSYKLSDDTTFVSDIRYYDRSDDNIMFTLGVNYEF